MSPIKETNFFAYEPEVNPAARASRYQRVPNSFPVKTLADYEAQFRDAGTAKAVGEASTLYLVTPNAAENIRSLLPNAKIIVSIRNPVERAFSNYQLRSRVS